MGTTCCLADVAVIERAGTTTEALAPLGHGRRSPRGGGDVGATDVTVDSPIVVVATGAVVGVEDVINGIRDEPKFGTATRAVTVTTQPKTTVRRGPRRRHICGRDFTEFNFSWSLFCNGTNLTVSSFAHDHEAPLPRDVRCVRRSMADHSGLWDLTEGCSTLSNLGRRGSNCPSE